jgi:hypothetical protein
LKLPSITLSSWFGFQFTRIRSFSNRRRASGNQCPSDWGPGGLLGLDKALGINGIFGALLLLGALSVLASLGHWELIIKIVRWLIDNVIISINTILFFKILHCDYSQ